MSKQYVYLVIGIDASSSDFLGVFSTLEKAELAKEEIEGYAFISVSKQEVQ